MNEAIDTIKQLLNGETSIAAIKRVEQDRDKGCMPAVLAMLVGISLMEANTTMRYIQDRLWAKRLYQPKTPDEDGFILRTLFIAIIAYNWMPGVAVNADDLSTATIKDVTLIMEMSIEGNVFLAIDEKNKHVALLKDGLLLDPGRYGRTFELSKLVPLQKLS